MKKITVFLFSLFSTFVLFAQNDTIPKEETINIEIYDVVAVYKYHTDSRGKTYQHIYELKGEILAYDEGTGYITFKGKDGKMYSFKSDEYKYFQYDKEFKKKVKNKILKPRKDSGLVYSAGLSTAYLGIKENFTSDNYYLRGFGSIADIPVNLKIGLSKYINKQSIVGLTAEFALLSFNKSYFNLGARYQYMYNTGKNAAFYFPAELKFSNYKFDAQYEINDTTFIDNMNWEYPTTIDPEVSLNSAELNVGQGISFAMKNKKSVSLELMFVKQFVLSQKFTNNENDMPNTGYIVNGLKLYIFINF